MEAADDIPGFNGLFVAAPVGDPAEIEMWLMRRDLETIQLQYCNSVTTIV